MFYVYIIQSINFPDQIYIGCTQNFDKRLSNHNCGTTTHTEKYKPWKLVTYSVFEDKKIAYAYEKYLKSGAGRAFAKKRFGSISIRLIFKYDFLYEKTNSNVLNFLKKENFYG